MFSKTSQTRRERPVWYNSVTDTYIFLSTSNYWHIASAKNYNADNTYTYAYSKGKNAKCPHDIDYSVWLGKWVHENDVTVTSGKYFCQKL